MQQIIDFINIYFNGIDNFLFYIVRTAGIMAYLLFFVASATGIMMSMKQIPANKKALVFRIHNSSSLMGLIFILLHFVTLIAINSDFSIISALLPFYANVGIYLPLGIIAFYCFVAVYMSSSIFKIKNRKLWRALHISSYIGYVLSLLHAITARPESNIPPILIMYALSAAIIVYLSLNRLATALIPEYTKASKKVASTD